MRTVRWASFASIGEDLIEVLHLEHAFHLLLYALYKRNLIWVLASGAAELWFEDIEPAQWLVSNALSPDIDELHWVKSIVDGRHDKGSDEDQDIHDTSDLTDNIEQLGSVSLTGPLLRAQVNLKVEYLLLRVFKLFVAYLSSLSLYFV